MKSRGLTLVEALVAVAVLGILLAVAAPSLADLMNRRRVQAVADQLVADLAYTRTETALRAQLVSFHLNVNVTPNCYSIHYDIGGGGSCDCARGAGKACTRLRGDVAPGFELKTYSVPAGVGVTIQPVLSSWPAGSPTNIISFDRPQMTPTPANAQILVMGNRGAQLMVQLNQAGRINMCSPGGSMGGVAPC